MKFTDEGIDISLCDLQPSNTFLSFIVKNFFQVKNNIWKSICKLIWLMNWIKTLLIDLHKLKADPFNAVNANDTGADIADNNEQQ